MPYWVTGLLVSEVLEFLGTRGMQYSAYQKEHLAMNKKVGPSLNTKKLYTCRRSTEDITANLTLTAT